MYILNSANQEELLRQLELVEQIDHGWSAIYANPQTGMRWLLFRSSEDSRGRGARIIREESVPKEFGQWLQRCFSSDNTDDITGLAWELEEQPEHWEKVLDWMDANKSNFSTEQYQQFLLNLGVLVGMNRREIVGKQHCRN